VEQTLPIYTIYGKESGSLLILVRLEGDGDAATIAIRIPDSFAGRDVDEEISLADLKRLGGATAYSHQDILGLLLETDGNEVKGRVGVGSGNEEFVLRLSDLNEAIAAFEAV